MIKVKVNNEYKDVVKIFCGGTLQKEITKVWSREAQEYVYESSVEYTDSLPITITANGDALIDYRIYGTDGGVGEPTENLIDASLSEQTIEIKPSTPYAVSRYNNNHNAPGLNFYIYDENDNLIWSDYLGTWRGENLRVFDNAKYFKITIPNSCLNAVSLVEGQRPAGLTTRDPYPENYIPYGYKLPMTVSDGNTAQTVPVYIGENQLTEDEYVSYGEQKIYRDVDGTLTPTDPPVPLPQIPTIDGTTVIDYDGDPKPSQMYIKYRR